MKVEFPNAQQPTPEDEEYLERLRILIERVVADGVVTSEEVTLIQYTVVTNKKFLPARVIMIQTLIRDKVTCGQLEVDLFDRLC